jgi:hypothetical protein
MAKTRRVLKRGKRGTRSSGRRSGAETIEGLQASFEKVDSKARALIEQGRTDSELVAALKDMWSDQFSADLSHVAAVGLVKHYRSVHKAVRKTRKNQRRGQKGGMAPMGWTMGQGTTDFTYGRFPVEIGTSPQVMRALDRFDESPISRACNSTGGAPAPGFGAVSAPYQGGGGLWDTVVTMGHPPTSVPQNILASTVSTLQGAPLLNPSMSPVSATVPVSPYEPRPFQPGELTTIRDMTGLYKP